MQMFHSDISSSTAIFKSAVDKDAPPRRSATTQTLEFLNHNGSPTPGTVLEYLHGSGTGVPFATSP